MISASDLSLLDLKALSLSLPDDNNAHVCISETYLPDMTGQSENHVMDVGENVQIVSA